MNETKKKGVHEKLPINNRGYSEFGKVEDKDGFKFIIILLLCLWISLSLKFISIVTVKPFLFYSLLVPPLISFEWAWENTAFFPHQLNYYFPQMI